MSSSTDNDLQSGQSNSNLAPGDVAEPPPRVRFYADSSALLVSKKGLEMERKMMTEQAFDPDFSFFRSSDPYHAYYQKKLAEYRAQKPKGAYVRIIPSDYGLNCDLPLTVRLRDPLPKPPSYADILCNDKKPPPPPPMRGPRTPPRKYAAILPRWLTGKELGRIKATAKSVAEHGVSHVLESINTDDRDTFEFMKPSDRRFLYFTNLAASYSAENLWKMTTPACAASDLAAYEESFRLFFEEKKKLHEGAELAVIDSNEFVWWMLLLEPSESVPKRQSEKRQRSFDESEGSEPKRQKFDESELVPEDQFLAQHPGLSSTISVFVPDFDDDWRVIEIPVESLSEKVASFKEKIAGEIQIPANRLKLIGKDGFFFEDDKSLAHYNISLLYANVSPDDILLKQKLDVLQANHPNLKVFYTVDNPTKNWKGGVGYISKDMALKGLPLPADDTLILVCGPPGMMEHISGGKAPDWSQGEVKGILKELGFTEQMVFKF